jgi:hypothetical protein
MREVQKQNIQLMIDAGIIVEKPIVSEEKMIDFAKEDLEED